MNLISRSCVKMSFLRRKNARFARDLDTMRRTVQVGPKATQTWFFDVYLWLWVAKPKTSAIEQPPAEEESSALKPYVFLDVNILREYLEHALKFNVPGVPWDLERAIDDWVFMCFFVGNDFLPHLPSLEIREGAISTLSLLWKQCMPMMGGYMTHNGEVSWWGKRWKAKSRVSLNRFYYKVDLKRVQILVHELGKLEDSIFAERKASKCDNMLL